MNIESQVTSLELSKKLKELNIEQLSIFYWYKENVLKLYPEKKYINLLYNISAYTASELISLLPSRITLKEGEPFNSFILCIKKFKKVKEENDPLDVWKNPEICAGKLLFTEFIPAYSINYECDSTECSGEDAWLRRYLFEHNIYDDNLSNALAKTLIFLTENKLI